MIIITKNTNKIMSFENTKYLLLCFKQYLHQTVQSLPLSSFQLKQFWIYAISNLIKKLLSWFGKIIAKLTSSNSERQGDWWTDFFTAGCNNIVLGLEQSIINLALLCLNAELISQIPKKNKITLFKLQHAIVC